MQTSKSLFYRLGGGGAGGGGIRIPPIMSYTGRLKKRISLFEVYERFGKSVTTVCEKT